MIDTLQELYKRELRSPNETVFLAECNEKHVLFFLTGSQNKHEKINGIIKQITFHKGKIRKYEEYLQFIDGAKLIYISNTLSEPDFERKDIYEYKSHVRYRFLYDCSLSGIIQNEIGNEMYRDVRNAIYIFDEFFCPFYFFVCLATKSI